MKGIDDQDDFGIVAEINMVPLIDVALVLLIIFMVIAPKMVQSQLKVKLPTAGAADQVAETNPMRVLITADGVIYVDDKAVDESQLAALMRTRVADPDGSIVVEGDTESAYGRVVKVFDAARAAGISKIGVAVQAKGGASRPKPAPSSRPVNAGAKSRKPTQP